jgi:tuftelin-interacting protein 11
MKHKDFQDEYDSDSDSDSDAAPPTYNNDQDDADSFIRNHQRKRRRTGGDAKESAALGIFGSDSEYENSGRWGGVRGKSLRNNVMEFVGADQNMEREEDSDEKEDVNFERQVKKNTIRFIGLQAETQELLETEVLATINSFQD